MGLWKSPPDYFEVSLKGSYVQWNQDWCEMGERRESWHEVRISGLASGSFRYKSWRHQLFGMSGARRVTIIREPSYPPCRERVLYWYPTGPNPLNHLDDFSRPALLHWSLNPHFPDGLISSFLVRTIPAFKNNCFTKTTATSHKQQLLHSGRSATRAEDVCGTPI